MSLDALERFAEIDTTSVSHCARLVLVWLANRYNRRRGYAYPTLDQLQADLSLPRRSLLRALADLESAGMIKRKRGGGVGNATRYHLLFIPSREGEKMTDTKQTEGAAGGTYSEPSKGAVCGAQLDTDQRDTRVPPAPERVPPVAQMGAARGRITEETEETEVNALASSRVSRNKPKAKKAAKKNPHPIEFDELKAVYPKRCAGERWADALRACNARLREGYSWSDIVEGAKRYAAWCDAKGDTGTRFVQMCATFCGPNLGFLDAWEITPAIRKKAGNVVSLWDRNAAAVAEACRDD